MELHEEALRLPRRPAQAVDAELGRLGCVLGQVARPDSGIAAMPALAAVLGVPDPGSGHGDRQTLRVARPRDIRVKSESTAAGLPVLVEPLLPERLVQLPALAA